MRTHPGLAIIVSLLVPVAFAMSAAAQQPEGQPPPAGQAPAPKKPPKPKPPAAGKPPTAMTGESKPTLLGQYGDWGAYTASPGGKKVCFAIAKPSSAETKPPGRPRNAPYIFVTTRPADKVTNEISVAIGYPFKPSAEATAQVGSTTYALFTEGDGAWIKNAAEEAHMISDMRSGETVIIKGESTRGTMTMDTYSLKGLSQALDRVAQECQ